MIYVIGFCGQVCSAFTVKVNMRFDNLNGEKLPIKISSIWSCKSIFILISVLQIFDFQCIERFLTTKNQQSLYCPAREICGVVDRCFGHQVYLCVTELGCNPWFWWTCLHYLLCASLRSHTCCHHPDTLLYQTRFWNHRCRKGFLRSQQNRFLLWNLKSCCIWHCNLLCRNCVAKKPGNQSES